jgi:hypothetical protein
MLILIVYKKQLTVYFKMRVKTVKVNEKVIEEAKHLTWLS